MAYASDTSAAQAMTARSTWRSASNQASAASYPSNSCLATPGPGGVTSSRVSIERCECRVFEAV